MTTTSNVVDLDAYRVRSRQAIEAVLAAPVRYVPDELLEALQGSWGEPEQRPSRTHLSVAR